MKLSALFLASASANNFADIANHVNSNNATWTADASMAGNRFGSLEDVATLCGTWLPGDKEYQEVDDVDEFEIDSNAVNADSIDWRTDPRAANCTVIRKIRDQSACGSCWAHGSTETFEDRRCIATGEDKEFSTEDTAGCCKGLLCGMSRGCGGGQPTAALKWMSGTGVVTGGDFTDVGKGTSCKPYAQQPCAHHVPATASYPVCPTKEYSIKCAKACSESSYKTDYDSDKVKGGTVTKLRSASSMVAALQKGPISVAFSVYADFPTYKSGVYKHTTGKKLGGHAVEIIGYGTDPTGGDYWTVKNSWNVEWGNQGTFNIARGSDECGIESMAAASIDF